MIKLHGEGLSDSQRREMEGRMQSMLNSVLNGSPEEFLIQNPGLHQMLANTAKDMLSPGATCPDFCSMTPEEAVRILSGMLQCPRPHQRN